jgi:hypothetical protein
MVVAAIPQVGKTLCAKFLWTSPDQASRYEYLKKFTARGEVMMNTVAEMTVPAWIEAAKVFAPDSCHLGVQSVTISRLSQEFIKITAKHAAQIHAPHGTVFTMHQLHGISTQAHPNACFPQRMPHFVVEILGNTTDASKQDEARAWAKKCYEELKSSGVVFKGEYEPFCDPNVSSAKWYSENWERLKAAKNKYDSKRVFGNAPPQI